MHKAKASRKFAGLARGQPRTTSTSCSIEMQRVTWPSWKQVRGTTGVVIIAVFAFAAYFAVVDHSAIGRITQLFNSFTK